jgi:hypothetical protein
LGSDPTLGRGVCEGPGNAQTDLSIGKNFKITERVKAKFSMDFFNVFNKTVWGPFAVGSPNCPAASNTAPCTVTIPGQLQGNFGVNNSTRDPLQIQYNLRIEF